LVHAHREEGEGEDLQVQEVVEVFSHHLRVGVGEEELLAIDLEEVVEVVFLVDQEEVEEEELLDVDLEKVVVVEHLEGVEVAEGLDEHLEGVEVVEDLHVHQGEEAGVGVLLAQVEEAEVGVLLVQVEGAEVGVLLAQGEGVPLSVSLEGVPLSLSLEEEVDQNVSMEGEVAVVDAVELNVPLVVVVGHLNVLCWTRVEEVEVEHLTSILVAVAVAVVER
jgi:hypothetical protein